MNFGTLALICLVGLVGPALAYSRRVRIPIVVGELIAGTLLGASGLRTLNAGEPTFKFLGELGFALVMFVAGTHVPIRNPLLRSGFRIGLGRAALVAAVALPAGLLISTLFGTGHGALYAVLIASSSAALVLPILAGTGAPQTLLAQLLPQVAIADTACIVALPLAVDPAHAGRAAVGAVAVIGCAGLAYLVLLRLERSGLRHRVHTISEDHHFAFELRVSLAILFGLAGLAVLLHVSVLLAGFSFGLAVAAVGPPRRLTKQVFALTEGFLAPVFFVWLGASIDLRDLAQHPGAIGLGGALGLAAVGVHMIGAATRQPPWAAMLTAAQLGVPVAAATLGSQLDLLRPGEAAALLLGALITIAVTSLSAARLPGPVPPGPGPDPARPQTGPS